MSPKLPLDRLADPAAAVQVVTMDGADVGAAGVRGVREPHRHDYHELLWTRAGAGRQLVDGRPAEVRAGTLTVVGRGQVHVFEQARGLDATVVRFGDEALPSSAAWLLGARGARVVEVPPGDTAALEAVLAALAAEGRRPPDPRSRDLQRHLLGVLLLWIERWYDATRTEQRDADDADVQLHRRFAAVLERDFAEHHDAAHYADALGVPPAALSRALAGVTGRPTKELVTDRVMLEAARLLRFTDLTVGQVAHRTGFADQLYFSRAFKRHHGTAPSAYRAMSMHR